MRSRFSSQEICVCNFLAHRVRSSLSSPDILCHRRTLTLPALVRRMPTAFSRPERSDRSANADSTPRGHRTPRGQRPQHTPRGGRSDFSDRRRTNNDDSNKETRNRSIEDAFNASLDQIRMNNLCFAQCILQVLRKQTGVRNERDHDFALQDWWQWQEKGSKHLSYLFRHTKLTHEDGSLSLNEMLSHGGTARKIRDMHKSGHAMLSQIDVGAVPAPLRGRNNTIRFLMPLAHVICDANKSCAMIGFLSTDNFAPGKFRKRIPGLNQPILAMMKVDNNKPMILMHKTLLAFLLDLRADIQITSPLHILHSVPLLINSDISCTAQTSKIFSQSAVADSFLEVPEEDGIMCTSL